MKILQVADRLGWAIDRLSKPLAEKYDNVDLAYAHANDDRFMNTGYTEKGTGKELNKDTIGKYDIVHFHRAKVANNYRSYLKGRKIVSLHNEYDLDIDWNLFDDIIVPTNYLLSKVSKLHPRVHLVPYGIDLNIYQPIKKWPGKNTVGYVGRVTKHKRFDLVQRAAYDAGLKMVACGYIETAKEFHKNEDLKLGRDYDFEIFLPEERIVAFYSRMSQFVCLSEPKRETGPLPVLEAMACGIPVISTKVGWAKDWATDNKNIIFVDELEVGNLKNIIKKLYGDSELRKSLRKEGLELIKNFGINTYMDKLMEVYEN